MEAPGEVRPKCSVPVSASAEASALAVHDQIFVNKFEEKLKETKCVG